MPDFLLPLIILGSLGLVFGALLGFASKKFAVKEDPLSEELKGMMPGANCGACGYVGCDDYAKAMAEGSAKPGKCSVGGPALAEKLASKLGVEVVKTEKMVAHVRCNGNCDNAVKKAIYYGAADCRQASLLPGGGEKKCAHGCLGFGTCVSVCPFGAIDIEDGVAKVNEELCTACGTCITYCPQHVIELVLASSMIRIGCNNPEMGKSVIQVCKVGCIGCGKCAKVCPQAVITMGEDNLPHIDYELCVGCGSCADACPRGVLKIR